MSNEDALKEYNRKVAAGEITRASARTPAEKAKAYPKSLRAAINAKCWDCCGFQRKEVTLCEITDCSLWIHRPWQPK